MNREGELVAIWLKRAKRGPMDQVAKAYLESGKGLRNNANRGGKRQVTIIEAEVWQRHMDAVQTDLNPSIRRANLLIKNLPLADSRGRILQIGNCKMRINGETKPCERMEEACAGLKDVMWPNWGGGAYAEVLDGGEIRPGLAVNWADE